MTQPSGPQDVNRLHDHDDVDATETSHHHTIGKNPTQAAAGNHTHPTVVSKRIAGRYLIAVPANTIATFDISTVGFVSPIPQASIEAANPSSYQVSVVKITSPDVYRFFVKVVSGLAITIGIFWTIEEAAGP